MTTVNWQSERLDNPADEARSSEELQRIFARVDSWYIDGVVTFPMVQARSSLAGDDLKTAPFPLSHSVTRNLLTAVDHFHALRSTLKVANSLHTYAPFTLIRGSLEGTLNALWLLGPTSRKERITRHILALRQDDSDQTTMAACLDEPPATSRNVWIDKTISASCLDRARVYGGVPSFGSKAKAVDALFWPDGDKLGEIVWRMCSGMAHGREWATLELLNRQLLSEPNDSVGSFRLTAGMTNVSTLAQLAFLMLAEAIEIYDKRSNPQY